MGKSKEEKSKIALAIWNLTEGQIKNFVRISKRCKIPDEKIEKCLMQMVVTAFAEVEEEEKANDGEPTEQA